MLAGIHVQGSGELPVLMRAAGILLHEIGAYQRCIDFLLGQPKNVFRDSRLR